MSPIEWAALPAGLAIGALGSLTGVGGGFLVMPLLLVAFPAAPAASLAATSMTVVFFNALSATAPALARGRIDRRLVLVFAGFSLPTAGLGLWAQAFVAPGPFKFGFGLFLLAVAAFIVAARRFRPAAASGERAALRWPALAAVAAIGFVSGFFGVGGGFLLVPLLVYGLRVPVRRATADSQGVLLAVSALSLGLALARGIFALDPALSALLVLGVVVGAQIGSAWAARAKPWLVMAILAALTALAAGRLLLLP